MVTRCLLPKPTSPMTTVMVHGAWCTVHGQELAAGTLLFGTALGVPLIPPPR